jgi:hypothetical protein
VSCHPPQVSRLTFAHPHPLPSARPIESPYAGLFWAPGQRGQNGLPRWCRSLVAPHQGKSALSITLNWALSLPRLIFFFLNLSRCRPSAAVVHPPVFFFESYASFSPFARPGAVPVTLSLLPLLFRSSLSWADGSKTHRRGVQSNCRREWLGAGGLCRGG